MIWAESSTSRSTKRPYNGAEKFKSETGVEYVEFEVSNASQREQALRRFAEDGRNPIVMTGFSWADPSTR